MADKSPEELQAEIERLTKANEAVKSEAERLAQANDDLKRTNRDLRKGGGPAPVAQHDRDVEVAALRSELARVKGEVAAEHGPDRGTAVCYQGPGEPYCRPARVLSNGFSARVPQPGGQFALHCHIEYGEPPHYVVKRSDGTVFTPEHTFEVDRAWNPLGAPSTWHRLSECPHAGGKGCPYGAKAAEAVAARAPQAP